MENLIKMSVVVFLVLGLNGCGGEDESVESEGTEIATMRLNQDDMPRNFSFKIKNINGEKLIYRLEDSHGINIFTRDINSKSEENMLCSEYSNEDTLVTYDCVIKSNIKEDKKESIILEKDFKYTFYLDLEGSKYPIEIGVLLIPKD